MQIKNTNQAIEAVVAASAAASCDARHRHLLRETLRCLVRQAKAEQLLEVRAHAARAVGCSIREYVRLRARMRSAPGSGQGEFEF